MKIIYRVNISGKILESHDLRKLLARAVWEKRNLDRAFRFAPRQKSVVADLNFLALTQRSAGWEVAHQVM